MRPGIPLGTLNHFARRVGLDGFPTAAAALRRGSRRSAPLGILDDRVFLCTATIGFYADAVRRRDRLRPRWGRLLAVGVGLAAGLRRMHVLRVVLEADDLRCECRTPLVWVRIAQTRTGGAAELEVVTARSWGSWSGPALAARMLLRVLRRRPATADPALAVFDARRLLLRGEGPVGVTLDGEAFSLRLPLWLAVQEAALQVVVLRETGSPTATSLRRDATPSPPPRRPGRLRSAEIEPHPELHLSGRCVCRSARGPARDPARLLQSRQRMKAICEDIKDHVPDVLLEWERRVREQPWYSLPAGHRIANLPDVIVGLVEASLCSPADEEAHRQKIEAAAEHGGHRRKQGIPEHLILTEYHLLRQAIWYYLVGKFGSSSRTNEAIMRIDTAITLATNASMWGYHREEIEALGKWDEGIKRMISSSPLLGRTRPA